jgi:hypothetical protein
MLRRVRLRIPQMGDSRIDFPMGPSGASELRSLEATIVFASKVHRRMIARKTGTIQLPA